MKLKDVCVDIWDCPHTTANDEGEGYPLIRTPNIGKGRFILSGVHRVCEDVYNIRNKRAVPQDNDLIFAREAPAGNVAIIKNGQKFCLGQRTVLIRPDKDKVNPDFLNYFLLAPEQQHSLLKTANGSTSSHVNMKTIRELQIDLPARDLQDKAALILCDYDEIIELNQRRISVLEEMAMRIYREWFVYFRFPGHESCELENGLPKGWKKEAAQHFFDISIGKTPPRKESHWFTVGGHGIPWLSISDMRDGSFVFSTAEDLTEDAISKHNIIVVEEDTVLLSFKLTVGRVSIAAVPMCTNEAIAHFKTDDSYKREYCYCYLKGFPFATLGSTSSIATAINSKTVKKIPFILPSIEILESFSNTTRSIFNEIKVIQNSIFNLQQMRDRLLPQLMSGLLEI